MQKAQDYYPACPEALIVSLARSGDRYAFEELVRRRQLSVRNLMRRCCNDLALADDLAQQVFLQVWLKIKTLKSASAFSAWLKRLAVTTWLQYLRKNDALRGAGEFADENPHAESYVPADTTGVGMDLDRTLATLSNHVRLCVVLSYQEGMSHAEISKLMDIPLGTIKSHIKRGSERLQEVLSAYRSATKMETSQ